MLLTSRFYQILRNKAFNWHLVSNGSNGETDVPRKNAKTMIYHQVPDMQWQAYIAAKFAEISQNRTNNDASLPPAETPAAPAVIDTPDLATGTIVGPVSSENTLPTDPTQGWHLNTINAKDVWKDYTGDGVLVGIVDDGFAYTHPDLAANYDTSVDYDIRDSDNDAYGAGGHGTKVAGVIGAASNGSGTVGVSYGADITGFRIGYGSSGSYSKSVKALDIAGQTADIVNSSWGYSTTFTDNFYNCLQWWCYGPSEWGGQWPGRFGDRICLFCRE